MAELEKRFAVQAGGNYQEEATGKQTGKNILFMHRSYQTQGDGEKLEMSDSTRKKLFESRRERVRPLKDDKILTSWNGLMIAALARAGGVLGEASYLEAAEKAANFILSRLRTADGALPSAGSVALLDLLKLGRMMQNRDYEDKAIALIRSTSQLVETSPLAFTFFLSALDFQIGPSIEVVIVGHSNAPDTRELAQILRREFVPNKVVLFRPADLASGKPQLSPWGISTLPPFTLTTMSKAVKLITKNHLKNG